MGERIEAPYGIELHKHRFATWAASRGATVVGCRFSVECGRTLLEKCGFTPALCRPEQLPRPQTLDEEHRKWRAIIIRAGRERDLHFTHGIAAKIINLYLKSRFVCGGYHAHEHVLGLHPPIDSVLLRRLAEVDLGGHARAWRLAAKKRWSEFDSEDYEQTVAIIRESLHGRPLWMIEEYWRGNR